jgi:hypothetical protein
MVMAVVDAMMLWSMALVRRGRERTVGSVHVSSRNGGRAGIEVERRKNNLTHPQTARIEATPHTLSI